MLLGRIVVVVVTSLVRVVWLSVPDVFVLTTPEWGASMVFVVHEVAMLSVNMRIATPFVLRITIVVIGMIRRVQITVVKSVLVVSHVGVEGSVRMVAEIRVLVYDSL